MRFARTRGLLLAAPLFLLSAPVGSSDDRSPPRAAGAALHRAGTLLRRALGDAQAPASIVEAHRHAAAYRPFVDGLGLYGPAPLRRGPFVHVDARGRRVRW